MLLPLVLILTTASPEPVKVAAPGLGAFNMPADGAAFFSDHFAQQLSVLGLRVTTASEIQTMLGVERQKQLLACSEEAGNCMAELASALGVDAIVSGAIGKVADVYQVNLKILAASDGHPLSVFSGQGDGDKDLLRVLTVAAHQMAPEVLRKLHRLTPEAAVLSGATGGLRSKAWIPAAGGAVLAALGTYFLVRASNDHGTLTQPVAPAPPQDPKQLRDDESLSQTLGWVGLAAGVAGLATGGVFYLAGGPSEQTTVVVRPGAGQLVMTGTFP